MGSACSRCDTVAPHSLRAPSRSTSSVCVDVRKASACLVADPPSSRSVSSATSVAANFDSLHIHGSHQLPQLSVDTSTLMRKQSSELTASPFTSPAASKSTTPVGWHEQRRAALLRGFATPIHEVIYDTSAPCEHPRTSFDDDEVFALEGESPTASLPRTYGWT